MEVGTQINGLIVPEFQLVPVLSSVSRTASIVNVKNGYSPTCPVLSLQIQRRRREQSGTTVSANKQRRKFVVRANVILILK